MTLGRPCRDMEALRQAIAVSGGVPSETTPRGLWLAVLTAPHPHKGLQFLQEEGTLGSVFPEIQRMVGFGGQDQGHKDLWDHTLKVVRQTRNRPALRWAALFHDVGKPVSFSRAGGKISFHHHEHASARLFKQAARRTALVAPDLFETAHFLVEHLGMVEGYDSDWTDSAVRRLHKVLGPRFRETLLLARADCTTKHTSKRIKNHTRIHDLSERAAAIALADAVVPPLPKGIGDAISRAFNIPPSRKLGEVKKALESLVDSGEVEAHRDISFYMDFLVAHRARFGV